MRRGSRRAIGAVAAALAAGFLTLVPAAPAGAHPLGNFTVNTYSGLSVEPDRVAVDFVVDMAEIPTFQARRGLDADGDGRISDAEGSAWASRTCTDMTGQLTVAVDGTVAPLTVVSTEVSFPPGSAGLDTMRIGCRLQAGTGRLPGQSRLTFRSDAFTDRVGWREVTVVGDGTRLSSSDVPTTSISDRLTRYPDDLLQSPLDRREASVRVRSDGGRAGASVDRAIGGSADDGPTRALPRGVDSTARSFMSLVARRDLTLAFGALAVGLAVLLGGIHALAPGHGKTVLAAYLVGQRGSLRQGRVIALTVTATHTAGVLILGLVLSASTTLAPESLYPWLGLASGVLLGAVGVGLLRRALGALRSGSSLHGHAHPHPHAHPHSHPPSLAHEEPSGHAGSHRDPEPAGHDGAAVATLAPPAVATVAPSVPAVPDAPGGQAPLSRRTLVAMGIAGGLVPSPSALVVLLGAMALGRAWFGVVLVVAYGAGMAFTLTAAGLLLVRARGFLDRRTANGRRSPGLARVSRAVPAVTAGIIVVVGVVLAARAVAQI